MASRIPPVPSVPPPEPDPLLAECAALRDEVAVTPPGLAATRRSVARRRRTRAVTATLAVLTVATLAGTAIARTHQPRTAQPPPTPSATGTTPDRSPSPAISAPTDAPPAAPGAPSRSPSTAAATPACTRTPDAQVTDARGSWVTVAAVPDTLCPGRSLRVFWASYTDDGSGNQRLHRSQEYFLTVSSPSVRFQLDLPNCMHIWYVAFGDVQVAATIAAGADPYLATKLLWFRDNSGPLCP